MKRWLHRSWRRIVRTIGLSGPLALVLLLLAMAVAASMPRLNRELQGQYADMERRTATLRSRSTERSREPSGIDRTIVYLGAFPRAEQMALDLGDIFASAETHKVALAKGEYQLKSERDSPFVSYVATFPVHAEYGTVKGFVSDVLLKLPHASLDEMRLSREAADTESLDAVVRFTLSYRSQ